MNGSDLSLITEYFKERYPSPRPALEYGSVYQFLVAVILSAQCTDSRVNVVTAELFKDYGTPQKMLTLSQEELERKIFSCGLYKSKARHLLSATKDIVEKFDGEVPGDISSLRTLAGVGRKTANVVASVAFKAPVIAVDTHVFRVANRIGLVSAKNPLQTELGLYEIIPENLRADFHHYLIFHGRETCTARSPKCDKCGINSSCSHYLKNKD